MAGVPIITISPLADNWAVKFLSTKVFTILEEFEAFVKGEEWRACT